MRIFCIVAHDQHLSLLDRLLVNKKTIFSVFGNRLQLENNAVAMQILSHGNYLVADSEDNLEILFKQDGLKK